MLSRNFVVDSASGKKIFAGELWNASPAVKNREFSCNLNALFPFSANTKSSGICHFLFPLIIQIDVNSIIFVYFFRKMYFFNFWVLELWVHYCLNLLNYFKDTCSMGRWFSMFFNPFIFLCFHLNIRQVPKVNFVFFPHGFEWQARENSENLKGEVAPTLLKLKFLM